MDRKETEKLFRLARSVYRKAEEFSDSSGNADTLLAWSIALEPYSYDEVREAFFQWARSSPFAPKIAELINFLLQKPGAESSSNGAGEAWQAEIDAGKCFDAAETLGNVSRYAREHGLSWREAKKALNSADGAKNGAVRDGG